MLLWSHQHRGVPMSCAISSRATLCIVSFVSLLGCSASGDGLPNRTIGPKPIDSNPQSSGGAAGVNTPINTGMSGGPNIGVEPDPGSGTGDGSCAAQTQTAKRIPLDIYVML